MFKVQDVIDRVTLWGVKDNHSWKNNFRERCSDYPLLFDSRGQAKPAFWGVVAAGLDEASWQDARQAFLGQ